VRFERGLEDLLLKAPEAELGKRDDALDRSCCGSLPMDMCLMYRKFLFHNRLVFL